MNRLWLRGVAATVCRAAVVVAVGSVLAASTTGTANALTQTLGGGACANDAAAGGMIMIWGSTTSAQGTADSAFAAVDLAPGQTSTRLQCTNYGFSIPANAVINGITVAITKLGADSNKVDVDVKLLKATVLQTDNKASATTWSGSTFTGTYGSSSDLWSTTWTAADINNAGFGVAQSVTITNGDTNNPGAFVDSMVITIDYDLTQNNGDPCMSGTQCSSTFCADGVCCDTACTGPNQVCDAAGSVGTCVSLAPSAAPAMSWPGIVAVAFMLLFIGRRALAGSNSN